MTGTPLPKSQAVYLLAAKRTAVAPHHGAFKRLSLDELAAPVIQACLHEADLTSDRVDELVLGNALYGGGNPARLIALASGLPAKVAGLSIDRQCVSGLDAIGLGGQMIRAGEADIVIAGGVESASRRPIRMKVDPDGGAPEAYDRPPFTPWPDRDPDLHESAAELARARGWGREILDAFAVESHRKALAARGLASRSIVPLSGIGFDKAARELTPKLAGRAKAIAGPVAWANTALSADAAAFVVLSSASVAKSREKAKPTRLKACLTLGSDPACPALAATEAAQALLTKQNLLASDLTCVEVMEAYAAQAMATIDDLGLDPTKVNRQGGALARGHPIGASGAILAVNLFHQLKAGLGLACIAAAGGLGTALLLEHED